MKKKTKIFLTIVVSILIITAIFILVIHELSKYHTYTTTITYIEGEIIVVEDEAALIPYQLYEGIESEEKYYGHKVNVNDKIYVTAKYQLDTMNVFIKDSNGNKISTSSLNVGDTIFIITKDETHNDLGYSLKKLHNVKLIKVLDNHEN